MKIIDTAPTAPEAPAVPKGEAPAKRWRRVAALALVLISLLPVFALLIQNADIPELGIYGDEGLYLIGAKSLQNLGTYQILSVPGEPFQTKYPPLYPVLLSALLSPEGPVLSALKSVCFLQGLTFAAFIGASLWLFQTYGFNQLESAGMAAFLATSPWVVYWSLLPLPDHLFAALVLSAFAAERMAVRHRAWLWAASGFAVAAFLTKSAGVFVLPAIAAGAIYRRQWRSAAILLGPGAVAMGAWSMWSRMHLTALDHPVMWYYTDYVAVFARNGGLAALPEIFTANVVAFALAAGNTVVHDAGESITGRFAAILITAILFRGAFRLARISAIYPVFCAAFALILCAWSFSPNVRLMLPLLPLFAISFYLEVRFLADLIRRAIHGPRRDNRVFAYILTAALLLGACYCIRRNTIFVAQTIPAILDQERQHKRAADSALEWCRRSLPASSVFLACNDTYFYFKTGIKAVRPIPDSVAFYTHNRERTLDNFRNIKSFTRQFGITHILLTPGDYSSEFESGDIREIFSLLTSAPGHREVYSSRGTVVLEIGQNSRAAAPF